MSVLNGSSAIGFLAADAAAPTGYSIAKSLRFEAAVSSNLSRTFGTATDKRIFTWSSWVKLGILDSNFRAIIEGFTGGQDVYTAIAWSSGKFAIASDVTYTFSVSTDAVFRDPSAWYHLVVVFDTTQSTSTNRIKIYVNGVQQTLSGTYPNQNSDTWLNNTNSHRIGSRWYAPTTTQSFDGYLADINFIDGQALTPSSFGQTNATTGVWDPIAYTGTFGNNGFWLKLTDNSNNTATTLGKDYSGNNNNWTPNNISVLTGGPTSVAAASGALPIYNTTDTYGTVKGTGTRTDSNSSSIVLALPMEGANNGTTFTDESATIKGSGSAKTITRVGDSKTSTARSKYYGSSGLFDGSNDYLLVGATADLQFGAGDFCIECWWYPTSTARQAIYHGSWTSDWSIGIDYNSVGTQTIGIWASSNGTNWNMLNADGGGNGIGNIVITQNKWNHIAYTRSGNTFRLFINGVLDRQVTASGTIVDRSSLQACIGVWYSTSPMASATGNLQDFRIYKGVAKYTNDFNPPTSSIIGTVAATNDSSVDSPTSSGTDTGIGGQVVGNYCVFNPLNIAGGAISNGGLFTTNSGAGRKQGTFGVSSGKWYWEVLAGSTAGVTDLMIGIMLISNPVNTSSGNNYLGGVANEYGYYNSGFKYTGGTASSYGSGFTEGDTIGVALDLDAGTLVFYFNGVSQGTAFSSLSGTFTPAVSAGGSSGRSCSINFGQLPFAYAAPSGFKCLCSANLPTPTITKGNTVIDAVLWTGNGGSQSITGYNFSPDFVWIKSRSVSGSHCLHDVIRGATKGLHSDSTQAEWTDAATLTAFNSNGFSLGGHPYTNGNGNSYVGWAWDAGSSTVTNNSGTIASQVRANASAGMSVVTYSGNTNVNATVGHGLNVNPGLILLKGRSNSFYWRTYHSYFGTNATQGLYLNDSSGAAAHDNYGGIKAITSSTFGFGTNGTNDLDAVNKTGIDYVAYCFAPVAGYSAFGSYTGNGSADGPFVYTGFRPRWVMIKNTSNANNWYIIDTARDTYNLSGKSLMPNLNNAEASTGGAFSTTEDILSNGFKLRDSGTGTNTSNDIYIYAAFAENPFNIARAR